VDGKISDLVLVARGVVQCSVLGPLMFSLFINDIASRICHCWYHLYADDVQLYLSGDIGSISDCISRMNLEFESLHKWTIENGLSLNPRKIQASIINCPPLWRKTHLQSILQANRLCTAKALKIWDWCSRMHFSGRIK
jgi:hypothetical protein